MASAENIVTGTNISRPELSAILIFSGGEMYLPLAGIIDIEKERGLLEKRLKNVSEEISRIENKLSNRAFIEKAPEEVVLKERDKYKELTEQKSRIQANLSWLNG